MDPANAVDALVRALRADGHLRSARVEDALRSVPRERFLPASDRARAYDDEPVGIGHEQTISAPHMVAIMTEALEPLEGARVLEVGTGSGYQAAILGHLAGPRGSVVSVERVPDLARRARRALADAGIENVEVIEGDGSVGLPGRAPFDRILVAAAAPRIPAPLVGQLAAGGRLLVPVGRRTCELFQVDFDGTRYERSSLGMCAFVPLLGEQGQGPD